MCQIYLKLRLNTLNLCQLACTIDQTPYQYILQTSDINDQWRIQDFLDGGANPEFQAKTYYLARFLLKTA